MQEEQRGEFKEEGIEYLVSKRSEVIREFYSGSEMCKLVILTTFTL